MVVVNPSGYRNKDTIGLLTVLCQPTALAPLHSENCLTKSRLVGKPGLENLDAEDAVNIVQPLKKNGRQRVPGCTRRFAEQMLRLQTY